ncbi:MAG: ribose-phosphate pyrophosphokinase [Proteobacteria bacterium]|nr:ribose-phosphate pyrophosphokinase [Pseudomonadota bacterium]
MNNNVIKIFTGGANPTLAQAICDYLDLDLGRAEVRQFSDGETLVELGENVRGMDVFLIQPTCAPANANVMDLLILLDAIKRASAKRITVVTPYYGYSRQDRKVRPRSPISAKLIADLLSVAGAQRVLCVELQAGQIQGFFDIPVDNLFAMPVLLQGVSEWVDRGEDLVVVSPDAGGVERARAFAKRLDAGLAIADKRREKANVSEVVHIVGEVSERTAIIVDDIVDTAGSLTQTADAVTAMGARRVLAAVTHPVLSGPALKRIEESSLERLLTTDTIPLRASAGPTDKIGVTTVSHLLGEAIRRIHNEESVSSLFD